MGSFGTERLLEINKRLSMLSDRDKKVLESVARLNLGVIDHCVISADLYVLPSDVQDSLEKLEELQFLHRDQSRKTLAINENGRDANTLLKVIDKTKI